MQRVVRAPARPTCLAKAKSPPPTHTCTHTRARAPMMEASGIACCCEDCGDCGERTCSKGGSEADCPTMVLLAMLSHLHTHAHAHCIHTAFTCSHLCVQCLFPKGGRGFGVHNKPQKVIDGLNQKKKTSMGDNRERNRHRQTHKHTGTYTDTHTCTHTCTHRHRHRHTQTHTY